MRLGKNWKTTGFGIGSILSGLGALVSLIAGDGPLTLESIGPILSAILAGIGLLRAKDKEVTGGTEPQTAEAVRRVEEDVK